jgi:hypothetical protein
MKASILFLSLIMTSSLVRAAYEDYFPAYFEYCSGTQWKLQTGEEGGTPGHGFTYIHGLCKDYRSNYPQVIPCSEVSAELKAKYPHQGVGVSLDKNFTNVMWVAVPGRDLMIFGETSRKAILNSDAEVHIQKVKDLKVFNEVRSKSENLKPYTPGTTEYLKAIAMDALGTDLAPNWARELHCVKIPTPKENLSAVANFLNASNNQYKNGPKEYEWSKLSNNCVHLAINTSHAMGITDDIELDQKNVKMLLNMALPANGFMMYADLAVLEDVPNLKKLGKVLSQKSFYEVQVGAMMEVHPVYPSGDIFNTDKLTVLTAPRIGKPLRLLETPKKYEEKYMTPSTSHLKENAQMWITRYEALLHKLKKSQRGTELESYLMKQLELSKKIAAEE